MDLKFVIFIVIASILTIAVYSSSTNSVSAATDECFGTSSQGYVICSSTVKLSSGEDYSILIACSKDKDSNWKCEKLGARVMPPGIDDAIRKSMTSDGLSKSTK